MSGGGNACKIKRIKHYYSFNCLFYLLTYLHQDFHQFHLVLAVAPFNDIELDSIGAVDCVGFLIVILLLLVVL